MAIITIDEETKQVAILIERTDELKFKTDELTVVNFGSSYTPGALLHNSQVNVIMMRGER